MTESHFELKVTDHFGQEYRLEIDSDDEDTLYVYLWQKDRPVGRILCTFENEDMNIGDIVIWDNVIHGPSGCIFAIFKLFGWKPKVANYQNRGLGSILLNFAIEKAKQRGVKTITGAVVLHDYDKNPHLLAWYQKHGFQISKGKGDERKNMHYIRMDIDSEKH